MSRLFKRLAHAFLYWYYWCLDYTYVGWWQLRGFFQHGDSKIFIHTDVKNDKPPVLLLPGVYERWEFMKPVAAAIHDAGYDVYVIEGIGYNIGTVESLADAVDRFVRSQHLTDCIIVAHSKGGLIGKYLLTHFNHHDQFAGLIALNTPFSGSVYAYLFPLASLRIFTPNSPLISLLAKSADVNKRIISIYNKYDPHIPGTSFLQGATNVKLNDYGHFRIIKNKKAHADVLKSLKILSK